MDEDGASGASASGKLGGLRRGEVHFSSPLLLVLRHEHPLDKGYVYVTAELFEVGTGGGICTEGYGPSPPSGTEDLLGFDCGSII